MKLMKNTRRLRTCKKCGYKQSSRLVICSKCKAKMAGGKITYDSSPYYAQ